MVSLSSSKMLQGGGSDSSLIPYLEKQITLTKSAPFLQCSISLFLSMDIYVLIIFQQVLSLKCPIILFHHSVTSFLAHKAWGTNHIQSIVSHVKDSHVIASEQLALPNAHVLMSYPCDSLCHNIFLLKLNFLCCTHTQRERERHTHTHTYTHKQIIPALYDFVYIAICMHTLQKHCISI